MDTDGEIEQEATEETESDANCTNWREGEKDLPQKNAKEHKKGEDANWPRIGANAFGIRANTDGEL